MTHKRKLIVFDTTLRDGEQSPGVTLNIDEKLAIAWQLSRLGVDVIEAGFPITSPGDFSAVKKIAQEVGPSMDGRELIGKPATIAALARAVPKDIEAAYQAIKEAPSHRIHIVLATSDIHLQYKLKITREQCIQRAISAVTLAKNLCEDVEFSPEDGARSDPDFLVEILSHVAAAGATTINFADTVGYKTPNEFGEQIEFLMKNVKHAENVVWSAHCHNDLGLATANTLAGVKSGALQVEVAVNGIGERAGNTSLEEVVMNIHTRAQEYPVYHTINTKLLAPTSRMVSNLTGMAVQPNKAIVGKNAFLHESGIHQDGVLKNKETYEIIRPEDVGIYSSNMHLGKHSGRHAIKTRLEEIGYGGNFLTEPLLILVFNKFKQVADSKKSAVTDDDLHAIISDLTSQIAFDKNEHTSGYLNGSHEGPYSILGETVVKPRDLFYELVNVQVVSGTSAISTATVTLKDISSGKSITDAALAQTGPIDAVFSTISRIVNMKFSLKMYNLTATGFGSDSVCKATVQIKEGGGEEDASQFTGVAADTNILTASTSAYVSAINKMLAQKYNLTEGRSSIKERSVQV